MMCSEAHQLNADEKYSKLAVTLQSALNQAIVGKGYARHVVNVEEPFENQISMWIEKQGFDYALGQAVKKAHESLRLSPERAIEELKGAIIFIAMKIIALKDGA